MSSVARAIHFTAKKLGLRALTASWALVPVALGACTPPPPAPVAPPPPPPAAVETPAPPVAAASAAPVAAPPAPVLSVADPGFAAPESVLHDVAGDVYLVANVAGSPSEVDKNGFISKVGPDGRVLELKWIDGSKPGTTLDAPKGMAIAGETLYVADITWLRLFDRKTGAAKGKLAVRGATFLNDVTVGPDGVVYTSDTGWKATATGFDNTGSDAVFRVDPKVVVPAPLLRGKELGNPNGLAASADGVWVVSAKGELAQVTKAGKREAPTQLPKGGLDGVVLLGDGTFLVSSWEGKTVYYGKPGGEFRALLADVESPADIGFDAKRGRLLIPQMMKNTVLVYELAALTGGVPAAAPAAGPAAAPAAAPAAGPAAAPAAGPAAASARHP